MSLRGPCPTFLGLQSASFSDSHSFLLLLFFIYLIAFHFPPLLGPPLSVKPTPPPFHFALPSLPSSSPPNVPFVIFYRPPPPPPWPSPSDTSGCNFRTIRRERCLYLLNCTLIFSYSCQGTHSYRDVFVLSSRCSSVRLYPGGGYVGERRLRCCSGCTQRRALICRQLKQKKCVLKQGATRFSFRLRGGEVHKEKRAGNKKLCSSPHLCSCRW